MENIQSILNLLSLILLGFAVFSVFRMLNYLVEKGYEESKLYTFNPLFFLKYIEETKKKDGKSGVWFKLCIIFFILAIITDLFSSVFLFLYK